MRSLDYATLYFGSTIISMCSAIAMIYIWRVHRNDSAVRYWMLGFLCWSVSTLILTFRDLLPPAVSRLPGNLFGTFCITLLYVGTARFLAGRPAWMAVQRWVLGAALALLALKLATESRA